MSTLTLPPARILRSTPGFDLIISFATGYEKATHFDSFADAKASYEEEMADFEAAMWEMESEAIAERAAERYWEEGPASFRDLRAAEQRYEDERMGL